MAHGKEKATKIEIISILMDEDGKTCNECKCVEVCKIHEIIAERIYNEIIK